MQINSSRLQKRFVRYLVLEGMSQLAIYIMLVNAKGLTT